jgi:archaeosortase A (PGF-CTERM-specific)
MGAALGIIWVLNVGRNAFISISFGHQWFQQDVLVSLVIPSLYEDPNMTSFFIADRVIAELLAVVALVGITLLVVRIVPELLVVLEEALYVCTRRDVDLGSTLGIEETGEDDATADDGTTTGDDVPPVGDADPGGTGDD